MTATDWTSGGSSSSTTMRDDTPGSSTGTRRTGRGHGSHGYNASSTASRMSRTINTIPVWARQHETSPWQSPEVQPQHDAGMAGAATWPRHDGAKGKGDILQSPSALNLGHIDSVVSTSLPDPRGGPAGEQEQHKDNDTAIDDSSSASSSRHDASGPGRFWSVSFPRRLQRPPQARHGRSTRGESVSRRRGKSWYERGRRESAEGESEHDNDGASSSEASTRDRRLSRRRSSFGQSYRGVVSEAFASLTAGAYMGSNSANQQSYDQARAGEEEQGSPGITRGHDLDEDQDDEEKRLPRAREGTRGGWSSHESSHDVDSRRKRGDRYAATADDSFSRHQPLTPGWESPWRPESHGEHSIRIGRYRFNNHGEGSYFPRTSTRGSDRKRGEKASRGGMRSLLRAEWWSAFLLHNAFVPLLFRLINIAFTTSTLAIAIRIFLILRDQDAEDAVGSSPIVAIIFAPLSLVHVAVQIYLEYFSRPIGLWRIASKLFYTMTELIFVCLWSAELSLAFDNYFTSTLVCTSFQSPYTPNNDNNGAAPGQVLNMQSQKPQVCRLQGALIGLVFTSLLAYVVVFSLSLFRTFARVSKH